jgi:hypothetical protein
MKVLEKRRKIVDAEEDDEAAHVAYTNHISGS